MTAAVAARISLAVDHTVAFEIAIIAFPFENADDAFAIDNALALIMLTMHLHSSLTMHSSHVLTILQRLPMHLQQN